MSQKWATYLQARSYASFSLLKASASPMSMVRKTLIFNRPLAHTESSRPFYPPFPPKKRRIFNGFGGSLHKGGFNPQENEGVLTEAPGA